MSEILDVGWYTLGNATIRPLSLTNVPLARVANRIPSSSAAVQQHNTGALIW